MKTKIVPSNWIIFLVTNLHHATNRMLAS